MRVLVCGGRKFNDTACAFKTLDRIHQLAGITLIIEGDAPGADRLGRAWAAARGVAFVTEKAAWTDLTHPDAVIMTRRDGTQYDARAGHRRNQRMIDVHRPELVVAFPGNDGTRDMVTRAKKAEIEVREVGAKVRV